MTGMITKYFLQLQWFKLEINARMLYMQAGSFQLCPALCNSMNYSPPGSSVHGILQARILQWVAMPSSRGSSPPRDPTHDSCGSCNAGRFFTTEPLGKSIRKVTPGQMLRLSRVKWLSGMATLEQPQYFSLNPVHSTMPPPPEVSEH